MKKLLFGVLALGLLMTACEKDKEDSSSLKVSAESISFTKDASKKSIFIESNVQWAAISSDTTWCKLQPGRGVNSDSLYITALENDNLTERTANITVTGEGLSAKTIQVKQMGKEPHLALSSDSISYTAVASKKSIFVECNVQWVAISSDTTWCKLQPGHGINSDSLFVTTLENVNQTERTASITITAEGLTKTIQVKQAATPARLVKELLVEGKTVLVYEYDNLNRIVKYNMARGSGSDFMRYSLSYSGSNLVKSKYILDGETYKDSTITTYSKTGNVIAFLENSFKNNSQTKESSGKIYLTSDGKSVDKIDYDSTYSKKTITFKYDAKGNCIEKFEKNVRSSSTNTYTSTYSNFDAKYGWLSATSTPQWWLMLEISVPWYVNNYGKSIDTSSGGSRTETTIAYEYDKYGYPVVMDISGEGKSTITYIQAK